MNSAIQLDDVRKVYNKDIVALNNVSLNVREGEIFGLLGPNGSGKTTMIKCISQLATLTAGRIHVSGIDIQKSPKDAKEIIGLSPQEPKADRYFTIQTMLEYQAGYYGIPRVQAKERVVTLLKEFDLFDKRKEEAKALSGGMMRKLSLLKSLIHKPEVLILDEPTAALDVEARHDLWNHVRRVNNNGTTIFLTTHYIEEAEEMCDRICFLKEGEVIRVQGKDDLMNELSQNKIRFTFEQEPEIPGSFPSYTWDDNDVVITVGLEEQSRVLRRAIDCLEDNNIAYGNFTIKQDSLENIFRRMVQ